MTNRQVALLCATILIACSGFKYSDHILGNSRRITFQAYVEAFMAMLEKA